MEVETATNDGAELLWLTKREKLCIVTKTPTGARNNLEVRVAHFQYSMKANDFCEYAMPCKYST